MNSNQTSDLIFSHAEKCRISRANVDENCNEQLKRVKSDKPNVKHTHNSRVPDEPVYIPGRHDAQVVAPAIQMFGTIAVCHVLSNDCLLSNRGL